MVRVICSFVLLAGVLALTGCDDGKLTVNGTVKFEGTPIEEGDMIFEPDDKKIAAEGAKIKDGKYSLLLTKGKYKVRITANRKVAGKKGPMGEDFMEQFVPKKYNEATTLIADVTGEKKPIDFELTK